MAFTGMLFSATSILFPTSVATKTIVIRQIYPPGSVSETQRQLSCKSQMLPFHTRHLEEMMAQMKRGRCWLSNLPLAHRIHAVNTETLTMGS